MTLIFARSSPAELFVIVFVLALFILVPLVIFAIVFFALNSNRKNLAAWLEFSKGMGLIMRNPKMLQMKGVYNSCEINLSAGSRGTRHNREFFTYCVTQLPCPLRSLLNISSPRGFVSDIFHTSKMTLGQANFDKTFYVRCYNQKVLQKLLLSDLPSARTQNLMGDLMISSGRAGVINITDQKVYVENTSIISDTEALKEMLEVTTYLANRFKTARENLPLADWEKRTLSAWRDLAAENNLTLDEKVFTLKGIYKHFPLEVALETVREKWQTIIKIKFRRGLSLGLRIMPENAIHKALTWVGLQDIKSGIEEFDDAFIVKAKNIAAAKHILQPDLCAQLLSLKSRSSELSVTDEEISVTVDTVLGDRNDLEGYLQVIISIAGRLQQIA
jgi:hypothetical protein